MSILNKVMHFMSTKQKSPDTNPALTPPAQEPIQNLNEPLPCMAEYQFWTRNTAVYPEAGSDTELELNYLMSGIGGEVGELQNKYKKFLRDGTIPLKPMRIPKLTPAQKQMLLDELGDVLWYWVRIAKVLGHTPESVAQMNRAKLEQRSAENGLKNHS